MKNNNLKEYRKSKGLTQQELSDALGISRPQLSRIESGISGITRQVEKSLKKFDPKIDMGYIREYMSKEESNKYRNEHIQKDEEIKMLQAEVNWLREIIINLSEAVKNNRRST